ncbi:amino acid deaminase/aldolase [Streptomyces sp. NPDC051677]|uniref:amino acid deaminase/aldolase n=1 Tax=Streptomyces sp. NPDC051677 TaxID=3365669 RepID=UPI0037CCD754
MKAHSDAGDYYGKVFARTQPPFAFVDLDALTANAHDLLRRAHGKPVRIASKSLRSRRIIEYVLGLDSGFQGIMAFTLSEALWLHGLGAQGVLVAYPTTDTELLGALAERTVEDPEGAPVVMIDSPDHVELIEHAARRCSTRVKTCLDFDASFWLAGGRIRIGAKRTPIHTPEQAAAAARRVERSTSARLVGVMSYEAQIAGTGDAAPKRPVANRVIRLMQDRSHRELRERRAVAVAAISRITPLDFVNAGGTGDLELVASEPVVTEVTAGSGLYAPALFDRYSRFTPQAAAFFALPVVRRPGPRTVTVLGGGYVASGVPRWDRAPVPAFPAGLRYDGNEGAGEVQTPLLGAAAEHLTVGSPVFFRHAKAGELCERFNELHLVQDGEIVDVVPTYRGEGRCFL